MGDATEELNTNKSYVERGHAATTVSDLGKKIRGVDVAVVLNTTSPTRSPTFWFRRAGFLRDAQHKQPE